MVISKLQALCPNFSNRISVAAPLVHQNATQNVPLYIIFYIKLWITL